MSGKLRQMAGKPKKDRYKATSIEKFQTQFANELLNKLNPQIRKTIGAIRDYGEKNFVSEGEGIANFDAMKAATNIPGVLGVGVKAGIGVGNILGRTMDVNKSADSLIGAVNNVSVGGTKGKIKKDEANLLGLKAQMGEFDTLTKGLGANVKLATSDLLGTANAKIKRDSAAMNLLLPAAEYSGKLMTSGEDDGT